MNVAALIFAATVTFSPFAGIIAYIITYDEYQKHVGKKRAMIEGLKMAVFSLVVFVIVGLVSGFVFSKIVSQ